MSKITNKQKNYASRGTKEDKKRREWNKNCKWPKLWLSALKLASPKMMPLDYQSYNKDMETYFTKIIVSKSSADYFIEKTLALGKYMRTSPIVLACDASLQDILLRSHSEAFEALKSRLTKEKEYDTGKNKGTD